MLIKIITLNIAHGKGLDGIVDIERQAEIINKYKPDIVFLQEIDMYTKRAGDRNQIREFSKRIYLPYCSMESNITLEDGYYGDGIISRFPISFSVNYLMPLTDLNHEQRGILCNRISLGTAKINLFSVHLSTYYDERVLACKELNRIIEKIDKNEIIIIGGDFNIGVTRLGKGKYTFKEQREYDEYKILGENLLRIPNREDTWFSKLGQGCIDTMFYSNNIELLKYTTIDMEAKSDHSAIYAEFNI
jgi:endonuclease/exonuclease/phosphatase family metal-dependent hydrolase